ncbi:alpha/beta fold hydrolase [Corallococcus caeni]|uniref:thioesterase II family protein n=1 Tax=Corallococcus caeni TaxID=3082388 RepID=UPI002957BD45|nr:alpha/beta fold hydrolase [Corallococcus sp. KH5-1]
MSAATPSGGLAFHEPPPSAGVRLFCLPHAGGSASLFRGWQKGMGADIEVCPVQLPGRENRLREPPLRELPRMMDLLVDVIAGHPDKPFALFGHSMGALLAFELSRTLRARGLPQPLHLFVASYRAPQTLQSAPATPSTHDIDVAEARRLGSALSLSGEMAEEMLSLMRGTLLADTALCESYRFTPGPPLTCPLSAFRGFDDYVPEDATLAWRELSTGPFSTQTFLGDHFFLRNTPRGLIQNLRRSLVKRPASSLPSSQETHR